MEEGTLEDRVTRIEYAVWGLNKDNGMVSEIKGLRVELQGYINAERERRENDSERQRTAARNTALAALAAVCSLIGVIAMLLIVVSSGP